MAISIICHYRTSSDTILHDLRILPKTVTVSYKLFGGVPYLINKLVLRDLEELLLLKKAEYWPYFSWKIQVFPLCLIFQRFSIQNFQRFSLFSNRSNSVNIWARKLFFKQVRILPQIDWLCQISELRRQKCV